MNTRKAFCFSPFTCSEWRLEQRMQEVQCVRSSTEVVSKPDCPGGRGLGRGSTSNRGVIIWRK
jgi:hypothetical protein